MQFLGRAQGYMLSTCPRGIVKLSIKPRGEVVRIRLTDATSTGLIH
jgi:hypothetical protein